MEKASDIFKKIMLAILLLIVAAALVLVVITGLDSKSYLLALIAGAVWAAALLRLFRRLPVLTIKPSQAALWLTVFCFVIQLAWVLAIRIEPFSDYDTYWQCARALAFGTEIPSAWYIAMYPHILGCSSFIGIFVRLFGDSVLMVSVLNVLLTCLSGLLIFRICLDIASLNTACLAYLLWAVCPCKLMMNSLVFSEPLYTCLILLLLWLVLQAEKQKESLSARPWLCAACGIALGLLLRWINIVRPIAAILIIALFLWLVFLRGRDLRSGAQWKMWLILCAAALCVYSVTGKIWDRYVEDKVGMEPAAVPIYNIYVGFNEQTQGQWSAEDMDLLFHYMNEEGLSPTEAQEQMLPHLRERIASGIDFGRLFSSKLIAFLGNDELGGYTYRFTRSESFVRICMVICNVFYYGVLLAAVGGILRMAGDAAFSSQLLIPLYILGLTLAHMLVEVANRYHYSLIPLLIILAALGFSGSEKTGRSTP